MSGQLERPRWPFVGEVTLINNRHYRIGAFSDVRLRRSDRAGTFGSKRTIEIDTSNPKSLGRSVSQLNNYRDLFDGLRRDGMRVANFNYVIVESNNTDRKAELMTIVDEINGANLCEMKSLDQCAISEVDQSFTGYLNHLQRVMRDGGFYWWDMGPDQIVYGTRQGESEPHAYMIDVDPVMGYWTKLQRGYPVKDEVELEEVNRMGFNIFKVGDYLKQIERKASFKHQLTLTRGNLGKTVDVFKSSNHNISHRLLHMLSNILE